MDQVFAEDEIEVHDIHFAAYLSVSGCVLVRQRRQGQRKFFIFKNPAGPISLLKDAYYSNAGKVSAYEYASQIQAYKKMCFD